MKKLINSKESLKMIKNLSFIFLMIATGVISFTKFRIIGIVLVLIILIAEWRLYRCPHCNKSLDPRVDIDKYSYCPYCGKKI